jgi:hypothetical protein
LSTKTGFFLVKASRFEMASDALKSDERALHQKRHNYVASGEVKAVRPAVLAPLANRSD